MVAVPGLEISGCESKVIHSWLLVGCDCGFVKHVSCQAFTLDWTRSSSLTITSFDDDIWIIHFVVVLFYQFLIMTGNDHGYIWGGTIRNFSIILIDQFVEVV